MKPTREDVAIESWTERDRLGIWVTDKKTGKTIAEWWDDNARQMFTDGFFKEADYTRSGTLIGRRFEDSVLDYLESVGTLAKRGYQMPHSTSSTLKVGDRVRAAFFDSMTMKNRVEEGTVTLVRKDGLVEVEVEKPIRKRITTPIGEVTKISDTPKPHSPNPGRTSPKRDWFQKGVAAGKKDGWMDLENTVAETAAKHPEIKDPHELVWSDIDAWEETDHFSILYGSKMWDYARQTAAKSGLEDDPVFIATEYNDAKSEFWEGYLTGRREIGRDIYKIARGLIS